MSILEVPRINIILFERVAEHVKPQIYDSTAMVHSLVVIKDNSNHKKKNKVCFTQSYSIIMIYTIKYVRSFNHLLEGF